MLNRILRVPERSFFLFGVRGVGKSTWIQQALPNALNIDLLDERVYFDHLANVDLFPRMVESAPPDQWIVVDEIQRIPRMLNEVHRQISNHGRRFALLGSSARKLKTQSTNLLAGRASQRFMYPFVPEELNGDWDLEQILRYGTLPVVWDSTDQDDVLRSYVNLYLREEIRQEALVRNLEGFVRFLPVVALFHAQSINVSSIARDCSVPTSTVKGFLNVLEDTLVASRLSGYEARLRVRERKNPKLYLIDPGLARAMKNHYGMVAPEERGALFEGWIYNLLRTYQHTSQLFEEIHYWAPVDSSTEVDFIIQRGSENIAIEVKSATQLHDRMLKGLNAIEGLPGLTRRILIYIGRNAFRTRQGIEVMPVGDFIEALACDRIWL